MAGPRRSRRIVIITGTPGVGKHTIAGHLAQMAGRWRTIDLGMHARQAGLLAGSAHGSHAPGEVDTDEMSRIMAEDTLAKPGDYLIVGHLAPYVVPRDGVILAVILRRNPYDLARTYRQRGYPESKSLENTGAEVLGTVAYDTFAASYAATLQYDTTGRDPRDVAARIHGALCAACRGALPGPRGEQGPLDWLYGLNTTNQTHAGADGSSDAGAAQAARRMLEDLVPSWPRLRGASQGRHDAAAF